MYIVFYVILIGVLLNKCGKRSKKHKGFNDFRQLIFGTALVLVSVGLYARGFLPMIAAVFLLIIFLSFYKDKFHHIKKDFNERQRAREAEREERMRQEAEEAAINEMPTDSQSVLKTATEFKSQLDSVKDSITDSDMRVILNNFENTIDKLITYVKDNPDEGQKFRRVENYYLPTMTKLLSSYVDYVKFDTDSTSKIASEIKDSVKTLDTAMNNLLGDARADKDWDVMADISVLNQMLEQDGLKTMTAMK